MPDPLHPLDPLGPDDAGSLAAAGSPSVGPSGGVVSGGVDSGGAINPAPDPGRVAGHFAGVGDGDLLELAARDEAVRRLLVDVAVVVADVEAEMDASAGPTPTARRPLAADVRARALAAFAAAGDVRRRVPAASSATSRGARVEVPSAPRLAAGPSSDDRSVGTPVAAPSVRGVTATRRGVRWGRAAIAAAVLLVPGVGLVVSSRGVEAASLRLEGFDRVGASGDIETSGPRRLAIGQRVGAGAGERVALRLVGGTRVVLADRAQLAVGCDAGRDGRCGGAVFEIESGGVVVAAAAQGPTVSPVAVRVPDAGRVDVWSGAARVDREPGGAVSLSLRSDARVRWSPDGGAARELVGPAVVALESIRVPGAPGAAPAATGVVGRVGRGLDGAGPVDAAIDASAFRDLEFFGGPLRRLGDEVRVGCRRWRVLDEGSNPSAGDAAAGGVARARRSEMGGAPAIRFDFDVGAVGRVAWPADAPVYGARRLEVRFRAIAASDADGARPTVRVRLEGVPGAEGVVTVDAATATARLDAPLDAPLGVAHADAPPLLRALLPLPASFRDAPPGGLADVVLSWTVEGCASTVWFESVVFLEVGATDGRPDAGSAGGAPDVGGVR